MTETRYIRLTVTGISNGIDDLIKINEFKALKYHGSFHAPIISAEIINTYYTTLNIITAENILNMSFLYYNKTNKVFDVYNMTKDLSVPITYKLKGALNTQYLFMSNAYSDGTEVFSDTISLKFTSPTFSANLNRVDNDHFQVFPNPSSGSVEIVANREINESVSVNVLGIKGELIETIHIYGPMNKNEAMVWKGTGSSGKKPVPGIYFITIEGNTIHENLKVVLN